MGLPIGQAFVVVDQIVTVGELHRAQPQIAQAAWGLGIGTNINTTDIGRDHFEICTRRG